MIAQAQSLEMGMTEDSERQLNIIKFLVEKVTKLQREQEVFRLFVEELREKDQMVGIPDRIHRIRNSRKLKDRCAAYFRNLDSYVFGTEKLPDHVLQELIQLLRLDEGESN